MTRRGRQITAGLICILGFVYVMSSILVTIHDREYVVSEECGLGSMPVIYPKAGVYWKDCKSPTPLYLFTESREQ